MKLFSDTSDQLSLPSAVRDIVTPTADKPPVGVGPYTTMLDVPFSKVEGLGVNRSTPICVKMDDTLVVALQLLMTRKVQALAVVDDREVIVDVVSRADVMRMETQGQYNVDITIREALSFRLGSSICVFHEDDLLRDIVQLFVRSRVKELFIVDEKSDKLKGQLGVVELIRFIVENGKP